MYLSLSKTIAKFGGFRLGLGIRMNKKNSIWVSLLVLFIVMFQLMWYMMILCGWLMYAMCYGIYWCIKKIIKASSIKRKEKQLQNANEDKTQITND